MRLAAGLMVPFVCSAVLAHGAAHRTLTYEDRVKAQTAIERIYYTHQLGAKKSFDAAMPRTAIEAKVRKYLEQSAALSSYWKTAITDAALVRELERMAGGSRMPERLVELFGALGNDSFLIKECLARPALVDRLARNFYAFDPGLHADIRRRADELNREALSGELNPSLPHADRTVRDVARSNASFRDARVGQVSAVRESREGFAFDIVLGETRDGFRVASYRLPKTTWDAWWDTAHRAIRTDAVVAVASPHAELPLPVGALPCSANDTWDNGTLGELPEERSSHTAIWTGSVMVVWGGEGDDGYLNTGGRYDPATDTWTSVSTIGAPSARFHHTAVWTGRVMIVWGGRGPNDIILDTGGRYDPATDTWSATSERDAPTARVSHTAVWTGKEMIVWGGFVGADLATGALYDPDADSWTPITTKDAPDPRHGHVAVWTGDQMLIWGSDADPDTSKTGSRYNPATDSWKAITATGVPDQLTSGYTAVWTGTRMVLWGTQDFSVGAQYDPSTNTWTPVSTSGAPSHRIRHSAVWTGTRMVVWGGEGSRGRGVNTGGSYDPSADEWSSISDEGVPSARAGHTAVWTGSLMLVWGGYGQYDTNGDPPTRFNTGARYDPAADSWTPTSTNGAPSAQRGHTAVWTGTQMVVWGGYLPDRVTHDVNAGARYDPATDTWSPTATSGAPPAREQHTAVWTGSQMVVWGGFSDDGPLVSGGRYDPANDVWTPTSTAGAPSSRYGHTAVWTGSSMIVWGGFSFPDYLDTGARYDPASDRWTPTSTAGAPAGREEHTAVWTGSQMVVWGGEADAGVFSSGGRYDPRTDIWTPTSLQGAPSNEDHTAVWTGHEMLVWGGNYDDQGRYDPASDTWTAMSSSGAPSQRTQHSAIWTGREMVVWGGRGAEDRLDTGGRYNPVTDSWLPTSTTGTPSARRGHTAVWTGDLMLIWGGDSLIDVDRIGRYVLGPSVDHDGDGFTECEGDCDDTRANVHPGATESCDGLDNDCDGVIDNGGDALCDDANPCTIDACDSIAGACSHNSRPNGTVCDDGSSCTTGETCRAGACTPAFSSLAHPDPKTAAYYRQLCAQRALGARPYTGDALTDDDAACVGRITSTFAGLTSIDALCGALAGHGPATSCAAGDGELIAAALNICRARVCGEQSIVSRCRGNTRTTVDQSLADADAILDGAASNQGACATAMCELGEINNGAPNRRPTPPPVRSRSRR
jgi:N-acetylneuraminic acid mutarotase